jgi:2Fe-2S ferredoxin
MPKVTFISASGARSIVEVPAGETLMRAALDNAIEGILGECGGACCCATCHIYLDDASIPKVPPIRDMEEQMLEYVAAPRKDRSRLACQIIVTPAMDRLTVHLPPAQHTQHQAIPDSQTAVPMAQR